MNELYLKRLIVGGFDGVYEFSKISETKEWTEPQSRIYRNGNLCGLQRLQLDDGFYRKIVRILCYSSKRNYQIYFGEQIDFKAPYPRVSMTEAIQKFTGFDITGKSEQEL